MPSCRGRGAHKLTHWNAMNNLSARCCVTWMLAAQCYANQSLPVWVRTNIFGEGLSPRSIRSLSLPIIVGTPLNAPIPASPEFFQRLAARAVLRCAHAASWPLRNGDGSVHRSSPPRAKHRAAPRPYARIAPSAGSGTRHRRPAPSLFSPTPFLHSLIAASASIRTCAPRASIALTR